MMRAYVLAICAAGLITSANALAAEPAAQYSPDDVAKALGAKTATSSPTSTTPACPAGTVRGDDGLCEPTVESRGFSLASPAGKPVDSAAPRLVESRPTPVTGQRMASASGARIAPVSTAPVTPGDLLITFRLGAADLTPQGRANAKAVAQALLSPSLAQARLQIIGHTDASGSPDRNRTLSEDRAASVKAFLVSEGVDASRLEAKGVGSDDLARPDEPMSGANRRVEGKILN